MSKHTPVNEGEFDGIMIETNGKRTASRGFVREVQHHLGVPDQQAENAADWVLGKMLRFAALDARPIFNLDDPSGPRCSNCDSLWPFCDCQKYSHHQVGDGADTNKENNHEIDDC